MPKRKRKHKFYGNRYVYANGRKRRTSKKGKR